MLIKFRQVRHGARACFGETEFFKNKRKRNNLCSKPLTECKFSMQMTSFQELLLREAKVEEGFKLLSALKIFVS